MPVKCHHLLPGAHGTLCFCLPLGYAAWCWLMMLSIFSVDDKLFWIHGDPLWVWRRGKRKTINDDEWKKQLAHTKPHKNRSWTIQSSFFISSSFSCAVKLIHGTFLLFAAGDIVTAINCSRNRKFIFIVEKRDMQKYKNETEKCAKNEKNYCRVKSKWKINRALRVKWIRWSVKNRWEKI